MKAILTQILDCLSDTSASLDALELELAENGVLKKDAIRNRFQSHKDTVETHLSSLRIQIASLKD
jgi:hypothetical protein